MRILAGISVALLMTMSSPAHAQDQEWARGHIVAGGSWVSVRSTSVLLDRDSVDGFFFPAPPTSTRLRAEVTRNGGCTPVSCRSYSLSMNFHSGQNLIEVGAPVPDAGPRSWLGGCSGITNRSVSCIVPEGATTGEIAATSGVDLDVVVYITSA